MDAGSMGGMGGAGGAGGGTDWSQIAKLFGGGGDKKKKSIFPEDIQKQTVNTSNPFLESLVATIKDKQAEKAASDPGQILKQAFAANKLQAAPAADIADQPIQPMQQPAPLNPQELDEFGNPVQKRMLFS